MAVNFVEITEAGVLLEVRGATHDKDYPCGTIRLDVGDYYRFVLEAEAGVNTTIRDLDFDPPSE